ncbi:MAG: hypothetical protein M1813_008928 [Trichoglossum hirsutum]|nr:MAG: hypothetical protein M1813_008928 [Trichoglossum hirsutum]
MADGSLKPISALTKGDCILCHPTAPSGTPVTAEVSCILLEFDGGYVVRVTGTDLECSQRHPIKDPTTGKWIAADRIRPVPNSIRVINTPVYSVLLAREAFLYTFVVEGVVVAALGCNSREGLSYTGLVSHPFYSTYWEVEERMKEVHPVGFERGRVVVTGIRRNGDDDGRTESFTRDESQIPDWAKD